MNWKEKLKRCLVVGDSVKINYPSISTLDGLTGIIVSIMEGERYPYEIEINHTNTKLDGVIFRFDERELIKI